MSPTPANVAVGLPGFERSVPKRYRFGRNAGAASLLLLICPNDETGACQMPHWAKQLAEREHMPNKDAATPRCTILA